MPPIRAEVANSAAVLPSIDSRYCASVRRDLVGRADLVDLAEAQPADRVGQQAGDLGAERRGDLRRPRQQEVAGDDRLQVAPLGIDGLDAAPGLGLVHHVVVVERTDVDQLAGHPTEHDVVARLVPAVGQPGGHRHHRAKPLATATRSRWLASSVMYGSGVVHRSRRAASTRARSASEVGRASRGEAAATRNQATWWGCRDANCRATDRPPEIVVRFPTPVMRVRDPERTCVDIELPIPASASHKRRQCKDHLSPAHARVHPRYTPGQTSTVS